jgi:hypothetical protein
MTPKARVCSPLHIIQATTDPTLCVRRETDGNGIRIMILESPRSRTGFQIQIKSLLILKVG